MKDKIVVGISQGDTKGRGSDIPLEGAKGVKKEKVRGPHAPKVEYT